jgi:hypothetical protein
VQNPRIEAIRARLAELELEKANAAIPLSRGRISQNVGEPEEGNKRIFPSARFTISGSLQEVF